MAFTIVWDLEEEKIEKEFERHAIHITALIQSNIEKNLQQSESIVAFYKASNLVERQEFKEFVTSYLSEHLGIQALEWIPRVSASQRAAYEQAARQEGFPNFQITERNAQGQLIRAQPRAEYFPVYFVEPYIGNEAALGFDLASNSTRLEALQLSRDQGRAIATAPITLVQKRHQEKKGFLVFWPVYQNNKLTDSVASRRQNLKGFALSVFLVGDIVESALEHLQPIDIDIYILDQSAPKANQFLYGYSSLSPQEIMYLGDEDLTTLRQDSPYTVSLDVAGQQWLILAKPNSQFLARHITWHPWGVLSGGLLITIILVVYLSDRQRAESQLQNAKDAAEAANQAKSIFLAHMSHELRTPLNAILGFSQLMQRDRSITPKQQDALEIINRSGEHLLILINDILEMSKIEAGRMTLNQQDVDLHGLLDSLYGMLNLKAHNKGLQLIFERSPDVLQYVKTDEGKLRQVLINLLGNAIKFTAQGQVTLRVRYPTPQILYFDVEDTGPGIAADEIDRLFDVFAQTAVGCYSQEGSGLGLAISRKFVQLMGGDIRVASRLNQGSIFSFEVQVQAAEAVKIQTDASKRVIGLAPDQPNYRILVVEDTLESRQLLVKLFKSVGFEVKASDNGAAAVALWQHWSPDLIWMDMRMPVMDGAEATRQIRAVETLHATSLLNATSLPHESTVIIALTAHAFEAERTVILSSGCDDLVHKPFQEQMLFDKMAQYLGVQYIYDESTPLSINPASRDEQSYQLSGDSLKEMPVEWLIQLHQAATRLDENKMLRLIEQMDEGHDAIAHALTRLVNTFRFDQIVDLTQSIEPQN
ncbi:MAG: response regulator [Cyanothece sp. SIO1E1]|nr:response regulator [Cyanothece sp. SIO1E1]